MSENVSLRNENVEVTRRTVNRPLTGTEDAFVDLRSNRGASGESLVSKDAREEISLRKTAEQREETISDTVRKTEVEIDDERDGLALVRRACAGVEFKVRGRREPPSTMLNNHRVGLRNLCGPSEFQHHSQTRDQKQGLNS